MPASNRKFAIFFIASLIPCFAVSVNPVGSNGNGHRDSGRFSRGSVSRGFTTMSGPVCEQRSERQPLPLHQHLAEKGARLDFRTLDELRALQSVRLHAGRADIELANEILDQAV